LSALYSQGGKDDPQLTVKHKKRSRANTASSDKTASNTSLRLSVNGEETAMGGEASSVLNVSSVAGNDGEKGEGNCLEASALAAGDTVGVNPLSVETQLSESPAGPISGGSTTDTASEVASLIHSPGESSSVSTIDSSFEGRIPTKSVDADAADERCPLDDGKADLDNRLAAAAQVLASEDARASVLNTSDGDHAAIVKTGDGVPLPDGDADDGESSQKVNGQKCPPRFSTKVCTAIFFWHIVIMLFICHYSMHAWCQLLIMDDSVADKRLRMVGSFRGMLGCLEKPQYYLREKRHNQILTKYSISKSHVPMQLHITFTACIHTI